MYLNAFKREREREYGTEGVRGREVLVLWLWLRGFFNIFFSHPWIVYLRAKLRSLSLSLAQTPECSMFIVPTQSPNKDNVYNETMWKTVFSKFVNRTQSSFFFSRSHWCDVCIKVSRRTTHYTLVMLIWWFTIVKMCCYCGCVISFSVYLKGAIYQNK